MFDVVVLGAGVSGLTAAWRLEAAGLTVRVLEARDRVGGRTWSPRIGGQHLDLGATWIWEHERAVLALLDELAIETFPATPDGVDLFELPDRVEPIQMPRSWSPERRFHLGTQSIANALAENLSDIALNTSATRIQPHPDRLEVHTQAGSVQARHVVAALPPALLAMTLTLDGADPETIALLSRTPTWMADVAKVVAAFKTPFWRQKGLSGRAFSRVGPMQEIHDMSPDGRDMPGALFGFVHRTSMTSEPLEDRARAQFVRVFGSAAADPLALKVQAWWKDPETAHPDTPAPHEKLFGHDILRRPLMGGRLHMASTETAAVNTGHIDGAVHRAQEAAESILREMGEQA